MNERPSDKVSLSIIHLDDEVDRPVNISMNGSHATKLTLEAVATSDRIRDLDAVIRAWVAHQNLDQQKTLFEREAKGERASRSQDYKEVGEERDGWKIRWENAVARLETLIKRSRRKARGKS